MGRPNRAEQFEPGTPVVVHCMQRCVRRAFLAGVDRVSGKDYGFRREWIRRRMEALASVFGIDVLTYAIMSNHFHLIVRTCPELVEEWDDHEVALRWLKIFPGRRVEEYLGDPTETDVERLTRDSSRIKEVRKRLSDISWFMRALSEPIARMANRQDDVTGRFWEGRFKAQRIIDDAGLLACSVYVDINPVRAALAESVELAIHTSAYDRFHGEQGVEMHAAAFELKTISTDVAGKELRTSTSSEIRCRKGEKKKSPTGRRIRRDGWLAPLRVSRKSLSTKAETSRTGVRASDRGFLDLEWSEYLKLLRWTAERREPSMVPKVPSSLQPIMDRLGIDLSMWRDFVWNFKRYFGRSSCAGSPSSMSAHARTKNRRWFKGQAAIRECFTS